MTALIVILILFLLILVVVAPAVYLYMQHIHTERKNFDRGLKMVPLLIHLPPQSDDIEGGGRDVRDVVEENVSKAQVLYNIISSSYKKSFKNNFYGQRHMAFEIVGMHGFVYFYAAVPVSLVDVVKQAIISAYPSSQLEEVAEHNIFNKVGKINATTGGELSLKNSFVYPIATYQDLKRDALQSLLNSLAGLSKEDGVAVQILLRPANPSWQKISKTAASNKRKGKKGNDALGQGFTVVRNFLADLLTAFFKPPEAREAADKKDESLSGLEQSIVDSIEDKSRYPGFEVNIRLVASSNLESRSQSIIANIVSAFQLFDAPGKNGFKYTPAEDTSTLVSNYILRSFTGKKQANVLNSVELSTIFHFPDQSNIPTSQLERQASKQVDGPRNIPEEGLMLGYNVFRGVKKPIRLALQDRQRHIYTVGQTGTGKSTFLENLALQDMLSGNGFAFVDPHGDTAEKLLAMVPKERTEDVIYFSPAETDYPMGLNLFEFNTPDQKDFLIQEVLNMLYKLYDPQHQGIMGPRYENIFRNCALAIMADPNGGTFVDVPKLFRDPQFLKEKLQHVKDQNVLDYWLKEYPASQRSNEAGEVTAWFVSKFGAFLSNEMMRNIIGQTKSAFNLREIMDSGKILLVNLSKGRTGDLNSKLLGMIFVMKFQAAAMSRANVPEKERKDFCLYVDEFQNFSTDSFATIMSEARKYHLNLVVANQFTTQLTDEIRDAVFGNMGTVVCFRVGQNDAEPLVQYFQPIFDKSDLLRIPNYNAVMRTLVGGVPTQPFSMATLPPLGDPNEDVAKALKQLSAAKYGRPRAVVEKEIFDRMSVRQPVASMAASGGQPGGSFQGAARFSGQSQNPANGQGNLGQPVAAKASPTTFLDEWLAKKAQTNPAMTKPSPSSTGPLPNYNNTDVGVNSQRAIANSPSQTPVSMPSAPTAAIIPDQAANPQAHALSVQQPSINQPPAHPITPIAPTAAVAYDQGSTARPDKPDQVVAPQPVNQSEGEIHLHTDTEDAIYIDNNGQLHHQDSDKA